MRREFRLPSGDERFLARRGFPWEAVQDGERWVLIHEHLLPAGYDQDHITISIQIPRGYPESPLDMFYVHPPIARSDGMAVPATEIRQTLDGRTFQGWSRHRPSEHPWRAGVDNLESHYDLVCDSFRREFIMRPPI